LGLRRIFQHPAVLRWLLTAGLLLAPAASAQEGKIMVPQAVMTGHCITMVSPQNVGEEVLSAVVVRVVVSASGRVEPERVVSGAPALQAEAMNAVRLWQYKPFVRDGVPVDVMTDVRVIFEPGKPGGMVSHPNH
jgi:periplasmic protein TonB